MDEWMAESGMPRCSIAGGQCGESQCPEAGEWTAVTVGVAVPHLVIRVCHDHALGLSQTPGWGVQGVRP